jgi:hypothetical protein
MLLHFSEVVEIENLRSGHSNIIEFKAGLIPRGRPLVLVALSKPTISPANNKIYYRHH